jgi:CheY-like chemotaxis protein
MSSFDFSPYSILFVDDEGFTRRIVVQLLRSLGCEDVRQAGDVNEALDVLSDMEAVHIVIADFRMSPDNGLKLVKEIRTGNAGIDRGTPLAMLTGYSEKSLVEVALALDVNAFLVKPISRNILGTRLSRLLELSADLSWLSPPASYECVDVDVKITPPSLTAPRGENAVDAAPDKVKRALTRLPLLEKKYSDSDLADAIVDSVERLIAALGEVDATNMLAIFDALERHEIMTMQEIASMLAVPEKMTLVPDITLDEDLRTVDGEILFRTGTRVSRPIAAIIGDLNEVGALSLSDETIAELGLDPALLPQQAKEGTGTLSSGYDPSEGLGMRAVPTHEIQPGDVLARTVFTSDGRLYGKFGAKVTSRMVGVLNDLYELEKIASTIWVAP